MRIGRIFNGKFTLYFLTVIKSTRQSKLIFVNFLPILFFSMANWDVQTNRQSFMLQIDNSKIELEYWTENIKRTSKNNILQQAICQVTENECEDRKHFRFTIKNHVENHIWIYFHGSNSSSGMIFVHSIFCNIFLKILIKCWIVIWPIQLLRSHANQHISYHRIETQYRDICRFLEDHPNFINWTIFLTQFIEFPFLKIVDLAKMIILKHSLWVNGMSKLVNNFEDVIFSDEKLVQ